MKLIREAVKAGARLARACAFVGLSVRTFQRWAQRSDVGDLRAGSRKEPSNKLSPVGEAPRPREVLNSAEFPHLSPSQIVPILAERGEYPCSEASMYRLLEKAGQLAHRERSKEPEDRIPVRRVATRPNHVWSWDITYLREPACGILSVFYIVVDIWSREIVGWQVHTEESVELASALIRDAARNEGIDVDNLTLHSENGGPMKGVTMLATLHTLGIVPSFTRPRVSDDNLFSEALFKTLKYRPEYPKERFQSLQEARSWVTGFVPLVPLPAPPQRHRVRPPRRRDLEILENRQAAYEAAKQRHPERWGSGATRSWERPERVVVRARPNPDVDVPEASAAA